MKARLVQVESMLVEKISGILRREVTDPRVGFATVTRVRVSPDLNEAYVDVSVLGSPEEQALTIEALQKGAGFIQHHLGKQIHLRRTPHLHFALDHTPEEAIRLTHIIDEAPKGTGE